MNGQVTRRYFEEKARRLGLRISTDPDVLWLRPYHYHRDRDAEEQYELTGDYRLLQAISQDLV